MMPKKWSSRDREYKLVPSHDEEAFDQHQINENDETKRQNDQQIQLEQFMSNKNKKQQEGVKRTTSFIHIPNEPTPKETKTKTVVRNPMYNIDEYMMDIEAKNTNNNNNKATTSGKCRSNDDPNRNSFLNVLSKTIRCVLNQESSCKKRTRENSETRMRHELRRKRSKQAHHDYDEEDVRFRDIQIDLGDNNEREIELKMKIPRRCFTNTDLQILNDKKCLNLALSSSVSSEAGSELEEEGSIRSRDYCEEKMGKICSNRPNTTRYCPPKWFGEENSIDDDRLPLYGLNNYDQTSTSSRFTLTFIMCIICLLLNPLFGLIALVIVYRSRRSDECSSRRLNSNARCISVAGILITLLALVAIVCLFLYTSGKSSFFELIIVNSSNSTTTTVSPKHKQHFWWNEQETTSNVPPRITRNNNTTNMTYTTIATLKPSTTEERKQTTSSLQQQRVYDRLNILIDHDLLMNLNFKYKILNQTLTL